MDVGEPCGYCQEAARHRAQRVVPAHIRTLTRVHSLAQSRARTRPLDFRRLQHMVIPGHSSDRTPCLVLHRIQARQPIAQPLWATLVGSVSPSCPYIRPGYGAVAGFHRPRTNPASHDGERDSKMPECISPAVTTSATMLSTVSRRDRIGGTDRDQV